MIFHLSVEDDSKPYPVMLELKELVQAESPALFTHIVCSNISASTTLVQ